jgi:hypothetical protein
MQKNGDFSPQRSYAARLFISGRILMKDLLMEGCFMTRFISIIVSLAFAGVLLVSCEEKAANPTTPPVPPKPTTTTTTTKTTQTTTEAPTPPAPTPPATPPAPTAPKTTDATPAPASTLAGAVNAAGTAAAAATTCGLAGCGKTVDPTKFIMKDGKPIAFCCQTCLDTYKKNNNL